MNAHILKDLLALYGNIHGISIEIKQIAASGRGEELTLKLRERGQLLRQISELEAKLLKESVETCHPDDGEIIHAIESLANSVLALDAESEAIVIKRRDAVGEQLKRIETAQKHFIHPRHRQSHQKKRLVSIVR